MDAQAAMQSDTTGFSMMHPIAAALEERLNHALAALSTVVQEEVVEYATTIVGYHYSYPQDYPIEQIETKIVQPQILGGTGFSVEDIVGKPTPQSDVVLLKAWVRMLGDPSLPWSPDSRQRAEYEADSLRHSRFRDMMTDYATKRNWEVLRALPFIEGPSASARFVWSVAPVLQHDRPALGTTLEDAIYSVFSRTPACPSRSWEVLDATIADEALSPVHELFLRACAKDICSQVPRYLDTRINESRGWPSRPASGRPTYERIINALTKQRTVPLSPARAAVLCEVAAHVNDVYKKHVVNDVTTYASLWSTYGPEYPEPSQRQSFNDPPTMQWTKHARPRAPLYEKLMRSSLVLLPAVTGAAAYASSLHPAAIAGASAVALGCGALLSGIARERQEGRLRDSRKAELAHNSVHVSTYVAETKEYLNRVLPSPHHAYYSLRGLSGEQA